MLPDRALRTVTQGQRTSQRSLTGEGAMIFSPTNRHYIARTSLSPESCEQTLRERVYAYRPFNWSSLTKRPLIGHVSSTGFLIRKRSLIPHVFTPYSAGTFKYTDQQTYIDIRLIDRYFHLYASIAVYIIFSIAVFIAVSPGSEDMKQHGPFAFVPFVGLLLGGFLVLAIGNLGQWLMGRHHLRSLERILNDLFGPLERSL